MIPPGKIGKIYSDGTSLDRDRGVLAIRVPGSTPGGYRKPARGAFLPAKKSEAARKLFTKARECFAVARLKACRRFRSLRPETTACPLSPRCDTSLAYADSW